MRRFFKCLHLLLPFALFCAGGSPAHAAYPEKPIRIIVGFPAGSTGDIIARILAPRLSESLGQPIVVENKPGAGSSLAAEAVATAPADGYTLLLSTTANVINPSLYPGLRFNFEKDLMPVMLVGEAPALLIAKSDLPFNSIKDLIAAAATEPGKYTFGSSGNGTFTHLYGELFNQSARVKLTHIPYKGSSAALTDVVAGVVDLSFTPAAPVLANVKAGKVKALAVIGSKRMPALPDVQTFTEAKVTGFDSALWFGLNAPAQTPAAVVERLTAELRKVLAQADVKGQLAAQTIEVVAAPPARFATVIAQDGAKWAAVVKSANIKGD